MGAFFLNMNEQQARELWAEIISTLSVSGIIPSAAKRVRLENVFAATTGFRPYFTGQNGQKWYSQPKKWNMLAIKSKYGYGGI